ncbi:MAG TPA: biopolymer transporter ExbD [Verrucomicrobiae bacterium]|jgi:biopolymer transport protein ExbD|nr:biopolymer transporter ExbD [Verrucomicrobiae bacterium]
MKLPSPIHRRHSRIEIIPLIDIMFFLLAAFMMVSLQMDQTKNIHVNLPSAPQAPHNFKPGMLLIAVDKSGSAWLEKKQISPADLGTVLSNRFKLDTNLPVFISGDRDAREGAIQDVLKEVRSAGAQKIAFTVGGEANDSEAKP